MIYFDDIKISDGVEQINFPDDCGIVIDKSENSITIKWLNTKRINTFFKDENNRILFRAYKISKSLNFNRDIQELLK